MRKGERFNFVVLKIKRLALFCFGLIFFLFPGQNYYSVVSASFRPSVIREIDLSLPAPALYPLNFTGRKSPSLTTRSAVVLDKDSAVLLFGKNEKLELLPASTVKIMTALISLECYRLDDILTVGEIDGLGQDMKLVEGEKITVRNLLYGLLVSSANDAALILAQNYPGGVKDFVRAMNEKASELQLKDTYFANPTGLDSGREGEILTDFSYTTALDLARLASWALRNPIFLEITATKKITVTDVTGKIKHSLFNLNELLGRIEGLRGVKTGWTEDAGECLVSYVERNGQGIITVILGSEDRFGETAKLINWTFENHHWENINPILQ